MTTKLIDSISAQATRTLRELIMARHDAIDALYPDVHSSARLRAISDLHHLCHEMGLDVNQVMGFGRKTVAERTARAYAICHQDGATSATSATRTPKDDAMAVLVERARVNPYAFLQRALKHVLATDTGYESFDDKSPLGRAGDILLIASYICRDESKLAAMATRTPAQVAE